MASAAFRPEANALLRGQYVRLAQVIGVLFVGYLIIGIPLPVLPLHVHRDLGLGPFMVGVVAGAQFAASLVSRMFAGRFTDTRGPKSAFVVGLLLSGASGLLYLASLPFEANPSAARLRRKLHCHWRSRLGPDADGRGCRGQGHVLDWHLALRGIRDRSAHRHQPLWPLRLFGSGHRDGRHSARHAGVCHAHARRGAASAGTGGAQESAWRRLDAGSRTCA